MGKRATPELIDAVREAYLKHKGRHVRKIVEDVRARGWPKFRMQSLYGSRDKGWVGYIEKFKLREMLAAEDQAELNRINAWRGFEWWLRVQSPYWHWDWAYQRYIYAALERVTNGESKRLMIFLPPRHGKSELVTVRYAAWRLLKELKLNVIVGSYNQRLANRFSRKIKRVIAAYDMTGKKEPAPKIAALNRVDEWETGKGGGVKAVGVGAGVTGFGADLIVIDDPVKSRAEAESRTHRERVREWFNDDLHTRLEPGGAVVLIQTRWHEDDLAGRLLKEMENGGERWDVVSLPALAEEDDPLGREPGEALCPQRFDREALMAKKTKMGSYSFSALYQQRPTPHEGGLFKREWFERVVDRAPEGLRWCRGYDLAYSLKTSADYTASFRVALDARTGDLYIADGFRKRLEVPDQRRYIVERIREERDTEHGIEKAMHGGGLVQDLRREERISFGAFREVDVRVDKYTRSLAWANRAEAGKVVLVRGPWIDAFLEEVCSFPNSKHDDQVDAVSLAVQMLEGRRRGAYGF